MRRMAGFSSSAVTSAVFDRIVVNVTSILAISFYLFG